MSESTTEIQNDVKVEDAGPAAKRLTITVPADAIAEKIEDSLGTLAVQSALPGFRKGRAPRALVERRFGSAVKNEARSQIIADAYAAAVEQHELKPVGEPQPVTPFDEIEFEVGKPLSFAVDVEIQPEFELPDLSNLEIEKPMAEITDERIDEEIARHSVQHGEADEIDGDFAPEDRLIGPATVHKKGEEEPIFSHPNVMVVMPGKDGGGRGQVLGLMIDGLADLLKSRKTGDSLSVQTTGPEGHEREDIRGAELTIEFEIRVGQRLRPLTEAKLAEFYGLADAAALRDQMKLALEQRRDAEQAGIMRDQVHRKLIEAIDFELPQRLSATQAGRDIERARMEMLYRGMSAENVETRLAEMREESEAASRDRLKLFFILNRLADDHKVDVTEQEINGRIFEIAQRRGMRPDKVKSELAQSGHIRMLAAQIREHKAADRVVHQAQIKEVPADEWTKRQQEAAGEKKTTKKKTTKKTTKKKTSKKTSKK